jgi:NAD(P)-dependent dehydrogenase (short-subunit alcohol dehydrogenase family)
LEKRSQKKFAQRGDWVFGTTQQPESVKWAAGTLLPLDVQDERSVAQCVESLLFQANRIDVLVNNAGISVYGAIEELSLAQVMAVFETNFFGVVQMTQAVLPTMRRQVAGRVVNIGSVAGFVPMPFQAVYAASKHALAGWTETLDLEVRPFGIRAILIQPGFIRTDIDRNSSVGSLLKDVYEGARTRRGNSPITRTRPSRLRVKTRCCALCLIQCPTVSPLRTWKGSIFSITAYILDSLA